MAAKKAKKKKRSAASIGRQKATWAARRAASPVTDAEPVTLESALGQAEASLVTLRNVIDAYRKVFG